MIRLTYLFPAALLTICTCAQADIFTMNSSAGVWSSVAPPASASGVGTSQIRWGTPVGTQQSGYDYDAAAPPPVSLSTETTFLIGTFVHHNQPITGDTITGATLDITLNLMFGATSIVKTFEYDFQHVETPNTTPCEFSLADGATNSVPCDDRVSVLNSIPDQTFTVAGVTYTLDLLGFSQNGGSTISDEFFTTEGLDNVAGLYGKITSDFTATPEPSSFILLLSLTGGALLTAKSRFRKV